ncbi:MAG: hypothetical protein K6D96_06035 [Acetatifactor sp.]|nr:hypothetical protein [Acetatifactor sp.]
MKKKYLTVLTILLVSLTACEGKQANTESTDNAVEQEVAIASEGEAEEDAEAEAEEEPVMGDEVIVFGETMIVSNNNWGELGGDQRVKLLRAEPLDGEDNKIKVVLRFQLDGEIVDRMYVYDEATNESEDKGTVAVPVDVKIKSADCDKLFVTARFDKKDYGIPQLELSGNHDDIYYTEEFCYLENELLTIVLGPEVVVRGDCLDVMTEFVESHNTGKHNDNTIQSVCDWAMDGENPFPDLYVDKSRFYFLEIPVKSEDTPAFTIEWIYNEPEYDITELPRSNLSEAEYLELRDRIGDF